MDIFPPEVDWPHLEQTMNMEEGREMNNGVSWREKGALKVEEAAQALSIGRSTAWAMIKEGQLATIKIGRSRRVPVSEIERFIKNAA